MVTLLSAEQTKLLKFLVKKSNYIIMSEKIKSQQTREKSSLEMARATLGRVKEMDLTPEQKEKMMQMIDIANQHEQAGDKSKALIAYNELKKFLEEISKPDEVIDYNGLRIKKSQAKFLEDLARQKAGFFNTNAYEQFRDDVVKFVKEVDDDGNILAIDCTGQNLIALPELPPNLEKLNCSMNSNLTSLPPLPDSLIELDILQCQIDVLPELPKGLKKLDCTDTDITKLPSLPPNLEFLHCGQNLGLKFDPEEPLPASLIDFNCWNCNLDKLPDLPKGLKTLDCRSNRLTELPTLPETLDALIVDGNIFFELPSLPKNIRVIFCNKSHLTDLPPLPKNLQALYADQNAFSQKTIDAIKAHPNFDPENFKFKNLEDFV